MRFIKRLPLIMDTRLLSCKYYFSYFFLFFLYVAMKKTNSIAIRANGRSCIGTCMRLDICLRHFDKSLSPGAQAHPNMPGKNQCQSGNPPLEIYVSQFLAVIGGPHRWAEIKD